jgi:DNA gyrase subunit A
MLRYFLDFRFATVRRRFEFQLQQLENRIHVLNGFAIVFRGIDRALKIIRASEGKQDAAKKLMKAFPLDEVQTNAILELQLYRISKLEIDTILEELKEKKTAANQIRRILKSDKKIWDVVQKELLEIAEEFGDRRRTSLGSSEEITEFDAQSYIVRENTNVVVTRDGWIKRVGRLTKVTSTRVRDGDSVLDVVPGSTLDNVIVFAGDGVAHTLPINEIPVSSGYGEPLSKHVRLADGMGIVATITTDPRFTPKDKKRRREDALRPHLLIVTAHGQVMRVSLSSFRTHSTKTGRKFCRLRKSDRVVFTELISDAETMFVATKHARLIHFSISDAVLLGSAGIGVRGIKLSHGDEVLGAVQLSRPSDCLRVRNTNDKVVSFGQLKYSVTSRGGKGVRTSHRNGFDSIIRRDIDLVDWNEMEEE